MFVSLAVGTAATETNSAQPVVNDFEVLTRAEGKFAQKELAQDFIAKLFEKISQETSTDEFFGQLFTSEAIIHSDFKEPTARDFIIRVLSGEKRPDEFVTVSAPKTRTPWGLASLAATSFSSILSEDSFGAYELRWVWLLWNDTPFDGIKASLILFDVELPIGIEVS